MSRRRRKRPSYRQALAYVSGFRKPGCSLAEVTAAADALVGLIGHLFDVDERKVLADIRAAEAAAAELQHAAAFGALNPVDPGVAKPGPITFDRTHERDERGRDAEPIGSVGGIDIIAPRGRVAMSDPPGTHPACTYCASAIYTDGPAPAEGAERTCGKCGRVWKFVAKHGHTCGPAGGRTLVWSCPKRVS